MAFLSALNTIWNISVYYSKYYVYVGTTNSEKNANPSNEYESDRNWNVCTCAISSTLLHNPNLKPCFEGDSSFHLCFNVLNLLSRNVQVLYVLGKLNCMLFYCFAQIQLTMLARHKQSIVMRIALAAFA